MDENRQSRIAAAGRPPRWICFVAMMFAGFVSAQAQTSDKPDGGGQTVTLDRVVAVVNRQTILASDLEDEIQISVLDPSRNQTATETAQEALDHLISRTLIQQQIQQENVPAAQPSSADIAARVQEMRTELPACIRANCQSDAGWNAFLGSHNLSTARVESYLRERSQILSFIELRFRQGIRITPEEIEAYYRKAFLPQIPAGQTGPPLQQVSSRIEEVLLQQRVTALFDNWLSNLRSQGQIEILDPALETARTGSGEGATKE